MVRYLHRKPPNKPPPRERTPNSSSDTIADSVEKYTLGADGKRVYTLKKVVDGKVSKSA